MNSELVEILGGVGEKGDRATNSLHIPALAREFEGRVGFGEVDANLAKHMLLPGEEKLLGCSGINSAWIARVIMLSWHCKAVSTRSTSSSCPCFVPAWISNPHFKLALHSYKVRAPSWRLESRPTWSIRLANAFGYSIMQILTFATRSRRSLHLPYCTAPFSSQYCWNSLILPSL